MAGLFGALAGVRGVASGGPHAAAGARRGQDADRAHAGLAGRGLDIRPGADTLTPAYYEWQGGTYTYAPARVIGGGVRHPVNTGRPFSEVEQ